MVPSHCKVVITFPNNSTEPRMVKNFLVVVTMEQVRGPKYTTVMKMKVCNRMGSGLLLLKQYTKVI